MSNAITPTMGQLQARVRQLETQLTESNAQRDAAEAVPRAELDQEKAAHDATKVELARVKAKLAPAEAKIARGIVHNKHRDWDAPVLARQAGALPCLIGAKLVLIFCSPGLNGTRASITISRRSRWRIASAASRTTFPQTRSLLMPSDTWIEIRCAANVAPASIQSRNLSWTNISRSCDL